MRTAPDLHAYFVTDAGLCESAGHTVRKAVTAAVEGGATCVQLRAENSDGRPFPEEVLGVVKAVGKKVPVIVNDRVDVFLAARALGARVAGAYVGQSNLSTSLIHILVGGDAYLDLSIGTQEEIQAAREEGTAGHVGLSALRTATTKTDIPDVLGFEGCECLKRTVNIPAVMIGEVGVSDIAQFARIGINGGAIVSAIYCAPDPAATAAQLLTQWNEGAQE